ncbi:unnamed protein product [Danaus chrysippus]|uniref:(African queen) hypothetical protein n=1 Tax=Danaus chrysippus TaxID=151541 RepID=A0A8J2QMY3_9NEOP|nr:unnamed protein product [Danaus chrysippus]
MFVRKDKKSLLEAREGVSSRTAVRATDLHHPPPRGRDVIFLSPPPAVAIVRGVCRSISRYLSLRSLLGHLPTSTPQARVYITRPPSPDTPPQITAYKANFIGTCMQYAQGARIAAQTSQIALISEPAAYLAQVRASFESFSAVRLEPCATSVRHVRPPGPPDLGPPDPAPAFIQALAHDVRAASNLNSRRLRDASAASAAPDLMNREWGSGPPARGVLGAPGGSWGVVGGDRTATASSARISDARVACT